MNFAKTVFFIAMTLCIAGAAQATHLVSLEGTADCEGWQLDGLVHFGSAVSEVDIDYTVDLVQDGAVVMSASGSLVVSTDAPWANIPFDAMGTWGEDLCGLFVVEGSATMSYPDFSETLTFTTLEFDCDCPPDEPGCFRTPGYWKNHAWPVESLTLGGVDLSRDALMGILWSPVRGDATVILAHHLIAAKLNVISGSDDGIQGTIDDADAYLVEHPVFSRPGGADKAAGLALKDLLADYNEQGCDDDDGMDDPDPMDKAAAVETHTWSNVKDLYR
jgi:hypothetical protein